MSHTHLTAPTQFAVVDGDRFAYRRFRNAASGQPPLFLVQHFRGGMDHWDPLLTDGFAASREVILYNGRGIASSSGTPQNRMEDMADDIAPDAGHAAQFQYPERFLQHALQFLGE